MLHPWKRTQVHSSGGLKHTLADGRAEHHQPGISLLGNNSDQSGLFIRFFGCYPLSADTDAISGVDGKHLMNSIYQNNWRCFGNP
jgi:hypothetical protein